MSTDFHYEEYLARLLRETRASAALIFVHDGSPNVVCRMHVGVARPHLMRDVARALRSVAADIERDAAGPLTPCGSVECAAAAAHLVHWPGKSLALCDQCTERAIAIAGAIDLELTIDQITFVRALPTL